VTREYPEATLNIIGWGPQGNEIRSYVREENVKNVVLHGRLPDSQVIEYLRRSWIIVNPALYEGGHPYSVLEGLVHGNVPVLSRIPVHSEIVAGTPFEEYLFEPLDSESMAGRLLNAVSSFINNGEVLVKTARQIVVERFDRKVVRRKLVSLYERLSGDVG
jgi:glycosyltransferase involved in cell wall biosynthesis